MKPDLSHFDCFTASQQPFIEAVTPEKRKDRSQIKAVILHFNPSEVADIKECQAKFQDVSVETALKTIHSNYKSLYDAIQKL
ncbi:hypothetical protein NQ318_021567 [Aromia moschata]|uniref:Uncharacterized protein n=1 Tax=Aromia moschata TaxID=1265417 RepID=A0AAV8YIS2_9CUCU|nr:hypothetical protein NQ318_021567 [Aromia moschata]